MSHFKFFEESFFAIYRVGCVPNDKGHIVSVVLCVFRNDTFDRVGRSIYLYEIQKRVGHQYNESILRGGWRSLCLHMYMGRGLIIPDHRGRSASGVDFLGQKSRAFECHSQ